jgi:hypothetical protein
LRVFTRDWSATLRKYDPEREVVAGDWLQMSEEDRLDLVLAYHRRRVSLPKPRLHAAIHVVVENQLALGEQVVIETLARLQREGLRRHDAIHAIGMVLTEHVHGLMQSEAEPPPDINARYFERLRQLSAEAWTRSGQSS